MKNYIQFSVIALLCVGSMAAMDKKISVQKLQLVPAWCNQTVQIRVGDETVFVEGVHANMTGADVLDLFNKQMRYSDETATSYSKLFCSTGTDITHTCLGNMFATEAALNQDPFSSNRFWAFR